MKENIIEVNKNYNESNLNTFHIKTSKTKTMNITVKDLIGLSAEDNLKLVISLLENRKPEEGSFDYGLETHWEIVTVVGIKLTHPIQVWQTNKRKSNKSPIVITIKKHKPLFLNGK